MPKNIIVCADGTGNKGGSSPDSNVYRIYKSVEKQFKGKAQGSFKVVEQIVFYDNGVGTETNKYLRALGGAFGLGFEDNVCDLYKFLARNYEADDRIYFFGFSRGASTVRACNGFISICGLAKGKGLRNCELDGLVKEAFDVYKAHRKKPKKAEGLKTSDRSHGAIDIHFMGIWDTVVALGFPKRTDVTGPVMAILNALFWLAEKGLTLVWPHSFYHYGLTKNVKYAHQALAIDDERTAFWPYVWREQNRNKDTVEQVWFAGMHSNVGGGYGRSGMASVALHWMMLRAEKRGLEFEKGAMEKALADSHIHGRMYNSRDGLAIVYRYHPREIEELCKGRIEGEIKLHRSVIERINRRTANYAPGQLPRRFEIVESDTEATPKLRNPGKDSKWNDVRAKIDGLVLVRKRLYEAMLTFLLAIAGAACYFRFYPPQREVRDGFWVYLANIFDYVLPDFFDGLICVTVAQKPYLFIVAVFVAVLLLWLRNSYRNKTIDACEELRHLIIHEEAEDKEKPGGTNI